MSLTFQPNLKDFSCHVFIVTDRVAFDYYHMDIAPLIFIWHRAGLFHLQYKTILFFTFFSIYLSKSGSSNLVSWFFLSSFVTMKLEQKKHCMILWIWKCFQKYIPISFLILTFVPKLQIIRFTSFNFSLPRLVHLLSFIFGTFTDCYLCVGLTKKILHMIISRGELICFSLWLQPLPFLLLLLYHISPVPFSKDLPYLKLFCIRLMSLPKIGPECRHNMAS